jgi:hypothetical protein
MARSVKNLISIFTQSCLFYLATSPSSIGANSQPFSFNVDTYYLVKQNLIDVASFGSDSLFSLDDQTFALALSLATGLSLTHTLSWNVEIASGEIRWDQDLDENGSQEFTFNNQAFKDAVVDEYFFIREFYFSLNALDQRLNAQLGRFHFDVGRGLVIDNYLFGVEGEYQLASNFFSQVSAAAIDLQNPFVEMSWGFKTESDDQIQLFADLFLDRSNSLTEILLQRQPLSTLSTLYFGDQIQTGNLSNLISTVSGTDFEIGNRTEGLEYLEEAVNLTTHSEILWLGVDGEQTLENLTLSGLMGGQWGSIHLSYDSYDQTTATESTLNRQADLLAYFAAVDANYAPSSFNEIDWGWQFLLLSGDDQFYQGVEDGKITAFLSIYPYFPYTNIFFNGFQPGGERTLGSLGIEHKGIAAPQVYFNIVAFDHTLSTIKATYLWSLYGAFTGSSKQLGLELNWENTFFLTNRWLVNWGIDWFNPGSFFSAAEPAALQLLAGLSYSFEGEKN